MKIITLTPEEKSIIDGCVEKETVASIGFEAACKLLKQRREELWDTLKDMYPEIKKFHRATYGTQKGQVYMFQKDEDEDQEDP